ncbi:SpaA isopeptide-forming pilin-related protein [Corynebacterium propinquum]|uniref:SpaA isopeptide-forming pilin-related protein n=1 Tax=Corynebacterium propinquum TaxID=43769 RepID=UPI002543F6E1|nr:SpaA isopeptide-forming pilin-related protein [Corynebacterium propinquum]MDK4303942.1 SpaA isopeptide-forming pilin-related protein [Corynebacterium propinquum]
MNNKLLLSRSVTKIAIVLVAVVAILVTLAFTAPQRAFADDNSETNVDLTENAKEPSPGDLSLEAPSIAPDGDSEDSAPVDGVVAPGNEELDSAPNVSGAEPTEPQVGEDRAPNAQHRGESRQARQRDFNTWKTSLENGPLVTMIRQEDRNKMSQVLMRHTIAQDSVISGPLDAKVEFQNGFDITGLDGTAELRVIDPNGREVRTISGNPNSNRIPAVDGTHGNGWGGVRFHFDGDITVAEGTMLEVDMVFHGRGKDKVRRQNPNFQGPLGPGSLNYQAQQKNRFSHPGQMLASCTRSLSGFTRSDLKGFRIVPNSNFSGEIKRVVNARFVINGRLGNPISEPLNAGITGLQIDGTFSAPVAQQSTILCVVFEVDADKRIDPNNVSADFMMALDYAVLADAPDYVVNDTVIEAPRDWDRPQRRNPELPKQCGLNIAVVMDASNSIFPNGVQAMTDSARAVVNRLEGTGSSVGIYNFASEAPRFQDAQVSSQSTNEPAGLERLNRAIDAYRTHMANISRQEGHESRRGGSTNWEASLKQIRQYNRENPSRKYDVVYFVTDGYPTVSDAEPGAGGEERSGGIVHVTDVNRARQVADDIKQQGTFIQPLLVGLASDHSEVVAKDSTVQGMSVAQRYLNGRGKVPGHIINTWQRQDVGVDDNRLLESLKFALDSGQADITRFDRSMVIGDGFGDVLASPHDPQPKPDKSRPVVDGKVVLDQRDWNSWAAGVKNPQEIGNIIGDNNAVVAEGFNDLELALSRLALASCGGSVTLTKELIDANGQPIQDASVAGWEFSAHTPEGSFLLADDRRVATTSASTDDEGHVRFQLETDKPDQHVAVNLTETQRPGFELAKLGNADDSPHAQCSVQHLETGITEQLRVQNLVNGFNVQASAGQVITCRVVNRKLPDEMRFKISKLDFETQQPIDGAKFQVFAANDQGQPDWNRGPVWDTDNQSAQTMNPGEYYLVETQAPQGYSLLPQPVYFELAQNERGTYLSAAAPFIVNTRIDQEQDAQGRPVYTAVMELANVLKGDLPLTGGRGIWGFALAGIIILAMGAYFVQRRRVEA